MADKEQPQDDAHRRFKEALDRKRAAHHLGAAPHEPGRAVVPSGNTKRQKTFRRKSG